MTRNSTFAALLALAFLAAACSKQAPTTPAAASQDDEAEESTTAAPAPVEPPPPPPDYAKLAQGLMGLLAHGKPECQRFHDELQAMIDAPAGSVPSRAPEEVVAEAHDAGCSTRSAR
jgi:PBP1b-binding outer membrane lipoprotein LpoB